MNAQQMKEREESLLRILGYKKFAQNITSTSSSHQTKLIPKPDFKFIKAKGDNNSINYKQKQKYPSLTSRNSKAGYAFSTQSAENEGIMRINNSNTVEETQKLRINIPPYFQKVETNHSQAQRLSLMEEKRSSIDIERTPKSQFYKKVQEQIGFAEEIKSHNQLFQSQRKSTPQLANEANEFSKSRKSLMLQFTTGHIHSDQTEPYISSQNKRRSIEHNKEETDSIFIDKKLNLRTTLYNLQKARMEETGNNQSLPIISTKSNMNQSGKIYTKEQEEEDKLRILETQNQQNNLKELDEVIQNSYIMFSNQSISKKMLQKDTKHCAFSVQEQKLNHSQTENATFHLPQQSNFHDLQEPQQRISKQERRNSAGIFTQKTEEDTATTQGQFGSSTSTKWKFNNPIISQYQQVSDIQIGPTESEFLNKQAQIKLMKASQNKVNRLSIKQHQRTNLTPIKNVQIAFPDNNRLKKKDKTKDFQQFPETQRNTENAINLLGKTQNFTQNGEVPSSKPLFVLKSMQTNTIIKNRQNMVSLNEKSHFNLSIIPTHIEIPSIRIKRIDPISQQSPTKYHPISSSPTKQQHNPNSPLKKKFLMQQKQDDNYSLMHKTLLEKLRENVVIVQYIEHSGYSVDMFAFYMMKLYVYCSENIAQEKSHSDKYSSGVMNSSARDTIISSVNPPTQMKQISLNFSEGRQKQQQQQQPQVQTPRSQQKLTMEFPTLKVNETTLLFVKDVFCQKMREQDTLISLVLNFEDKFSASIKQFLPQTFVDDIGGEDKVKQIIIKLFEYLCYEKGLLETFDDNLINETTQGFTYILRQEQHLYQPYMMKLLHSSTPISHAELYIFKISIWKVLEQMGYLNHLIIQVEQRITKQLSVYFITQDFTKEKNFKYNFLSAVNKNKKIAGYFLDPSSSTLTTFYDIIFGCFMGEIRYIDLVDFLEHKLKTSGTIPEIFLNEVQNTLIELIIQHHSGNSSNDHYLFLLQKDFLIKMERIKQKAGVIHFNFLRQIIQPHRLASMVIGRCEYALLTAILPEDITDSDIINHQFLEEYFFLVLQEQDQVFSIYDLEYCVSYYNIKNFQFCFSFWLAALEDIFTTAYPLPEDQLHSLLRFFRLNSFLSN